MASSVYPFVAIANLFIMLFGFAINALSGSGPDGLVFKNSTRELSDYFYTAVTPAGWTFSIWAFIYIWQGCWVVYSVANIFRKVPSTGNPVYESPMFIPPSVPILTSCSILLGMAWLVSFDRKLLEVSFSALIAYVIVMVVALIFSYRALDSASPYLAEQKRSKEIWLTRGLVHNGLSMQATWVSIAMLLNFIMILTYRGGDSVGMEDAGTVFLGIVSTEIVVFTIADFFFLDRYTRYTITPYVVFVVALSGSLSKNYKPDNLNSTFTLALLVASLVLLVVKVVVTVVRHVQGNRYRTSHGVSENNTMSTFK